MTFFIWDNCQMLFVFHKRKEHFFIKCVGNDYSTLWLFRIKREIRIFLPSFLVLLVITICFVLDADVLVTWICLPARFCLVSKLHQNNPADSPARRDVNWFYCFLFVLCFQTSIKILLLILLKLLRKKYYHITFIQQSLTKWWHNFNRYDK